MALIKGKHAGGLVARGLDLGDLKREAEALIDGARAEAETILAEARAEAQRLAAEAGPKGFEEGRQRGLEEGREQGRREGREEAAAEYRGQLEQLVNGWTAALETFDRQRGEMLLAARGDVLEFALAMGAKIARRAIEADPAIVADQVEAALRLVADPTQVMVAVNPQDREIVESRLEEIVQRIDGCEHVELREDEAVERGGCAVTAGRGRVDATVDRRIGRIVDALLGSGGARGA